MLRTAVIAAGGTGGHIFPGIALAQELKAAGWVVAWIGTEGSVNKPSLESKVVPAAGIKFHALKFSAVRGQGMASTLTMPFRLVRAVMQARKLFAKARPTVVVGFGGYPSVPAGIGARLAGVPLFLHEQNAVPGLANRMLANWANRVFTTFPVPISKSKCVGNPLRQAFLSHPTPEQRYSGRQGPLRLLVLGGSLGAAALNEALPAALALMPEESRPEVTHQSGPAHVDALRMAYEKAGVKAQTFAFIDDVAAKMAAADLIICRAGASTVTEIAAVGAAAIFVPYPSAVDDHQTSNARYLVDEGGGWILPQTKLTPERLARMLAGADRPTLLASAIASHRMMKRDAAKKIVDACEAYASRKETA
jgi:UDP-N-acetylglucosamine--N-acetylmuramyl-(pentapeptide) pyrophosphoryl-undecaprenol N-acetylglucosamine transferase